MEFSDHDVGKTAEHVWCSALGMDLSMSSGVFQFEPPDRIVSAVSFEGGFNGLVALECSKTFAARMAGVMFSADADTLSDEDIDDALREMTNITGGGLKAMAPRTTKMSLPTILSEEEWSAFNNRERRAWGFACDCDHINIFVDGRSDESEQETISVLLIEDSRVARRMVSSSLNDVKSLTFGISWCETLQEGLATISENHFDVVLLDLTLKDSIGLDTCHQVRQHDPDLPIVVLTSSDDESFALEALKAGAQDYLLKAEVAPTLLARSIQYAIERCRAEADRERLQQELLAASRQAGIAEMATGVLHNVGNVLNSVNLSATLVHDMVERSSVDKLAQTNQIISEHRDNFADFITNDDRGKLLPQLIERLATRLGDEREAIKDEVAQMLQNVAHIKEIVSAQQSMAIPAGLQVQVNLTDILDQAFATRSDALKNAEISVVREFDDIPAIWTDQHKVMQILANLIKNAEEAIGESATSSRQLTLRVGAFADDWVFVEVQDSGVGIAEEDVAKLFQHGFTTKKDGHGFGLHSCANAAGELKGKLSAHSPGLGHGATFRLELPINVQ